MERNILSKGKFAYTGCENLEAMAEAKKYNAFLTKLVTDTVEPKKDVKILDFGAGSGTYADLMKEQGYLVDCVEPDSTLQNVLKTKGYKVISGIASVKPQSYHVIYTLNVLEHIKEDGPTFDQLVAALKPGGKLVVYLPAFQILFSTMDERVEHYRRYRKSRLREFAARNELRVSTLHYCDPVGFFAALTYKLVGNKDGVISPKSVKFYDSFIFPVSRLIEVITRPFFGKNVVMIATKPRV